MNEEWRACGGRSADRQRSSSAACDVDDVEHAARPTVVRLSDPRATDVSLVGAKAANLALARAAGLPTLPGAVLTTAWTGRSIDDAVAAWRAVSDDGRVPVVVRSSSTGEDGDASSMAGVFESILDVSGEAAVARRRRGGPRVRRPGPPRRPRRCRDGRARAADARRRVGRRAVRCRSADRAPRPDGRRRRPGRPGRARVRRDRRLDGRPRPPWPRRRGPLHRRRAASSGRRAAPPGPPRPGRRPGVRRPAGHRVGRRRDGALHLLQARPITTLPPTSGTVFGPGPIAETFPDPLATLEQALWLDPLRDGLREALLLTGTSPARTVRASELVVAVDGLAAADLALLGVDAPRRGLLRRFDPRPPARRLRAAWRVGRLRSALPALATDLVGQVDADLGAVPAPDELTRRAAARRARQRPAHARQPARSRGARRPAHPVGRSRHRHRRVAGVRRHRRTRRDGLSLDELVALHPVVLALVPPRIGGDGGLAELVAAARSTPPRRRAMPTPRRSPGRRCACGSAGSRS